MAKIQCKMCGGELQLPENVLSGECQYCGTLTTYPKISSDELEHLYNRAEHFRRINEYDKAVSAYEKIVEVNPEDAEAYWGLVISKFGIEYVEDPVSHERIPTCHRAHYESILADTNYLTALEKAGSYEENLYETEAKRIAEIQKGILSISNNEQPFDIFICYKESDNYGRRTKDSVTAQEIYYQLTNAGYKVFFAKITLESKLGQQYEPYIFAALNSAKVMLVIGSEKEYFDAVWVRNEWSRFLALMKNDKSKLLIPCFRDMDAYDIPEALSMFQAQDMGKIGFIQDLLHGIQKVVSKQESAPVQAPAAAAANANGKEHPFLRRAKLFLRANDFNSAKEYCEKVLDQEPENGWAYFYRLMAENSVNNEDALLQVAGLVQQHSWQFACEFADDSLMAVLNKITGIWEEEERKRQEEERKRQEEEERKRQEEEYKQKLLASQKIRLSTDGRTLMAAGYYSISAFDIPEGVYSIAPFAFCNCRELRRITFPSTLTSIGACAFGSCSSLEEIVLPPKLNIIEEGTFDGCINLAQVTIPDGVRRICRDAFSGCTALKQITIPDSVKIIDDYAFRGAGLLDAVLPENVTMTAAAFDGTPFRNELKRRNPTLDNSSFSFVKCLVVAVIVVIFALVVFAAC